jgi:hypothetical protein
VIGRNFDAGFEDEVQSQNSQEEENGRREIDKAICSNFKVKPRNEMMGL